MTEVSALLGHPSPRVTLDVYSDWIDRDRAQALDLDQELAEAGGSPDGAAMPSPGRFRRNPGPVRRPPTAPA
jgi:hypothetical protein